MTMTVITINFNNYFYLLKLFNVVGTFFDMYPFHIFLNENQSFLFCILGNNCSY